MTTLFDDSGMSDIPDITDIADIPDTGDYKTVSEEFPEETAGFTGNPLTDSRVGVIEAVLFAAGYPVSYSKLAAAAGGTPSQIKKLVSEMADYYDSPDSLPRGIMLLVFPESCQFCTREEYGGQIRDALGIKRGGNLSASSLEVLAIVAYNEPVTRSFIDNVRGVDSAYAVNSLTEKHLIEPCGRLDVPGRPRIYRTTEDFLRIFGMSSLGDLPHISEKPAADGETIPMESMEFTQPADNGSEYCNPDENADNIAGDEDGNDSVSNGGESL